MVKVLDRYIILELIPPFVIGVLGFILIMITDILFTLTDLIINKGIPFQAVLKLLVFKLPAIIVLTFPVAMLFSAAMALGRLAKDGEIVALRTSGISLLRLSLPVLLTSLVISGASYITNEKIVPSTNHISENIIRQIILKSPATQIRENVFFRDSSNRYFYVRRVDPKKSLLTDIMVYEFIGERLPRVIVAKRAKFSEGIWDLEDGIIHKYDDAGRIAYQANFGVMRIMTNENILTFTDQKTPQEMSSSELNGLILMLKRGGVNVRSLLTDFYMKISIPLTCFVFALIGIPLSIPPIRSGRAFGIVTSIVIVFSFYVFASTLRSFGHGGYLPPIIAAFTPQVLFTLLGIILLLRDEYFK